MTGGYQPSISVVVPAYNAARFLRSTLESVLTQSYPVTECIVVDDGSVDSTADVVAEFEARATLIFQSNQGVAAARNRKVGPFVGTTERVTLYRDHGAAMSRQVRHALSPIAFVRRITRVAAMVTLPTLASCEGVVSRSKILSFLEAVQRPFDLQDQTWLGIPAALPAHLIVSALLAAALAWLWRPKAAGVLMAILILGKEAVDLMIIALYEPVTWAYASGSVVDVAASIAGAGLGLWVGTRARRRSVENDCGSKTATDNP